MTSKTKLESPVDIAVFGGTGDLSKRKLLPALFMLYQDGLLAKDSRVVAIARSRFDNESFRQEVALPSLRKFVVNDKFDEVDADKFLQSLYYFTADAQNVNCGWDKIADFFNHQPDRIRAFYLAVGSDYFAPICQRLSEKKIITNQSRLVVEKPIGKDLISSQQLNDNVGSYFSESQIFRIDHYLGKETVQNLMALRFANALFEPIWDSRYIDHVQITVAETIGVEGRAEYYDKTGAMRDMMQNHMLQLLCLVAMEPPSSFGADSVRDEKIKVLRALKTIDESNVEQLVSRGQYTSYDAQKSYTRDVDLEESFRESFVAIKAEVVNWRWAGTPFYMRTGKRLKARVSEIAVQFRPIPHSIFAAKAGHIVSNALVIRVQPDEGIDLYITIKDPKSKSMRLRRVALDMTFAEAFGNTETRLPDAYERLLHDVIIDDQTLFMRRDEVEAGWSWVDPIIEAWEELAAPPLPYEIYSNGPLESLKLMLDDGRQWRDLK